MIGTVPRIERRGLTIAIAAWMFLFSIAACPMTFAQPQLALTHDQPLVVVALASVDRLRARAKTLAESLGTPEIAEKLLLAHVGGDDDFATLLDSPGIDSTRPIGIMTYPEWFSDEGDVVAPDLPVIDDGIAENLLAFLANLSVEHATLVFCLPVKDREQILETISQVADETFSPMPDRTGWYQAKDDEDLRITFVGRYLLLVAGKQWDRNYPEFDQVVKPSLGKNGFVYAIHKRGLPKVIRDDAAEALKLGLMASLQRHDGESDYSFRWRTVLGPMRTELIDLLLSHLDEIRITGHVDSVTKNTLIDVEFVGPKDGKLARYAQGLTGKGSSLTRLWNEDASFSLGLSWPLNSKQSKPIVDALRTPVPREGASTEESAQLGLWMGMQEAFARTVDGGQLDLWISSPDGRDGLIAVKINGDSKFPELFEAWFGSLPRTDADGLSLSADSVEGFPIHHAASGEPAVFTFESPFTLPETKSTWWAATPQAIWFGWSMVEGSECPAWFKSTIEASLTKAAEPMAGGRSRTPFRMTMRGWGASPTIEVPAEDGDSPKEIQQATATAAVGRQGKTEQQERERGGILRDHPNAIHTELRPTSTGLKVSVSFEEAYFRWYASMLAHSLEETRIQPARAPEAVEPVKAKPVK